MGFFDPLGSGDGGGHSGIFLSLSLAGFTSLSGRQSLPV